MTAPYTLQHNGLAKRRNMILLDMTRSMLNENKFSHSLWGEAVSTASYVLNRCPTKKLKETIPFEKWTRYKKNVSHLRVFGYVSYKHVLGATRNKLDDRSKAMLLIGFHNTSAYNIYCPITNKMEVYDGNKSMGWEKFSIQL